MKLKDLDVNREILKFYINSTSPSYERLVLIALENTEKLCIDLEEYNAKIEKTVFKANNIWEAICMNINPDDTLENRKDYASLVKDKINNAFYRLKDNISSNYPKLSLYHFNKFGVENPTINIITLHEDEQHAQELVIQKSEIRYARSGISYINKLEKEGKITADVKDQLLRNQNNLLLDIKSNFKNAGNVKSITKK